MKNKFIIIGIIGVAAVVIYYLYSNRKKSVSELAAEATESNTSALAKLMTSNVSAVTDDSISDEDIEYNELVAEYKSKYRRSPDSSWTISQLKNRIAEYDQIQVAIDEYYRLEALIDEGDVAKTKDELGKMSLTEIKSLINQVSDKNKRSDWNVIKSEIEPIVDAFIKNVEDDGSAFNAKPYDTNILQTLYNYPKNYKIYANQYFREKGGAKTGSNYGGKVAAVYSISSAIPDGTRRTYRKGASWAKNVKDAYAGISGSLNEYGEVRY